MDNRYYYTLLLYTTVVVTAVVVAAVEAREVPVEREPAVVERLRRCLGGEVGAVQVASTIRTTASTGSIGIGFAGLSVAVPVEVSIKDEESTTGAVEAAVEDIRSRIKSNRATIARPVIDEDPEPYNYEEF